MEVKPLDLMWKSYVLNDLEAEASFPDAILGPQRLLDYLHGREPWEGL